MKNYIRHIVFIISLLLAQQAVLAQVYHIGDVIENADNSKGVVFWINPEHTKGWMVALSDSGNDKVAWMYPTKYIPGSSYVTNMLADTAGYQNTATILALQDSEITTATQLVDFKNGWYLPAAAQLRQLFSMLPFISNVIIANQGEDLTLDSYWTSTQISQSRAIWISFEVGNVESSVKAAKHKIRAIRSFTISKPATDTVTSYQWNNGPETPDISVVPATTTTYTVTATSRAGCSSRASKQIFVNSDPNTVIYDTIRRGEIYTEHGFHESEPGTYLHTLTGSKGCDITVTLHLTVLEPIPPTVFTETICEGSVYSSHNFTAWETGTYTQNWRTPDGNDSTVILYLTVNPAYKQSLSASVCQGEIYTGNGFNATETGVYRKTFTTSSGCDSVLTLNLTVNRVYNHTLRASICEGNTYTANGFSESAPGKYVHNLKSRYGCDSTVTLLLDVNPISRDTIDATIREGETYRENGFNESLTGLYTHTHTSTAGCDSLITLRLKVIPLLADTIKASICEGETYTANGFSESAPGIYIHHYLTPAGVDSAVILNLQVHPVYQKIIEASICQGETYTGYGFSETEPGTHTRHLTSIYGCDSTIRLLLTVKEIPHTFIEAGICQGETYSANGFNESVAGEYTHTLTSAKGCDSIVSLTLKVNPSYSQAIEASICEGEIYRENGFNESQAGTYTRHSQTITGCDSVIILNLNVHPSPVQEIRATICEGMTYGENGFTESSAGTYTHTFQTIHGCDSIVILHLDVYNTFRGEITYSLEDCETHTYHFTARNQNADDTAHYSFSWKTDNLTVSEEQSLLYSYTKPGEHRITLSVTHGKACPAELNTLVSVPYYPGGAEILTDRTTINSKYPRVKFWTAENDPGLTYHWDLGDGSTSSSETVSHTYTIGETLHYDVTLTLENADGCRAEESVRIEVEKELYIPNTFSPNNDGTNDIFMEGYQVQIVDRNGVIVYKGNNGWDGSYKGRQATEDTYFYILNYNNKQGRQTATGYITLFR